MNLHENKKDFKYYYQLRYTIEKRDLEVELFVITPDALINSETFTSRNIY